MIGKYEMKDEKIDLVLNDFKKERFDFNAIPGFWKIYTPSEDRILSCDRNHHGYEPGTNWLILDTTLTKRLRPTQPFCTPAGALSGLTIFDEVNTSPSIRSRRVHRAA
jgi:hypothetical protein